MSHHSLINLVAISALATALACNRGGSDGASSIKPATASSGTTGTDTATVTDTSTVTNIEPPALPDDDSSSEGPEPDAIIVAALARSQLFLKDTPGAETCVKASFTLKAGSSPVAGKVLSFSMSPSETVADPGSLTPDEAETDADGVAATTYCAGGNEVKVTLIAKYKKLQANTADITVAKKPIYSFKFVRSDSPIIVVDQGDAAQTQEGGDENTGTQQDTTVTDGVIKLNLLDSGPNDCTKLYFALRQGEAPYVGAEIRFETQQDFPKGAKLAEKDDAVTTADSETSGKKLAVYTATSNADGELVVPVCAGVDLGTVLVTGRWTGDDKKDYTAQAPVIQINAGLVNYSNMTLTYDTTNAKTLRGAFNNNVQHVQPFTVKLGARGDGEPILDYPVAVSTEFGQVVLENGGLPKADSGTVKFTVEAAHLDDYRPYQIAPLFNSTLAQTRCDIVALSQQSSSVLYSKLRMNWRSTVVYMVRGQESFYDANRNGVYDEGGDGFWDKNQNGIYDEGTDVLTVDAGGDGLMDINGEWFIDLPTPFIDVDENGSYQAGKDVLIGDEFLSPNGKRDTDTLIWKADYLPVYVGMSPMAMQRAEVKKNDLANLTDTIGADYYASLAGLGGDSHTRQLFATDVTYAANASSQADWAYLFLHDICGNPPPGGTKVAIAIENTDAAAVGDREVTGHIYIQPGDSAVDPARRLFASSPGSSEATVNFNISDHPAAGSAYPFEFKIRLAPCQNACTGDVDTPGVFCGRKVATVWVAIDDTSTNGVGYTAPKVQTCTCKAGANFDENTASCVTPPP